MYPLIPADEPMLAIILSNVFSPNVIHLTKAKDVNENTNVIHAAAAIEGINRGSHRYRNLPSLVFPAGKSNICSSICGSKVESTGSQNLMTRERLNQACATMRVANHVPWLERMLRPFSPIRCKNPIAATIDGITNGIVNIERIR
jgi:hypothetical protein